MLRIPLQRLSLYFGLLLAGLVAATCIRSGLFVAGGSDSSAYISAGEQWRTGVLYRPQAFDFWPLLPANSGSPLGYRDGPLQGTEVTFIPPGFPMLIAAVSSIVGPVGGHLVAPLMAGILVLCSFGIARELAGRLAGVIAAVLVGTSPELLQHSVQAMSDAPAAACWMAAWWLSLRPTRAAAVAAGLLSAMAILIRPNLAPLAVVIFSLITTGEERRLRWQSAALFVATSGIGVAVFLWTQATLYGGPLTPGYPNASTMFNADFIATNARAYPRLFVDVHSALPLAGLAMLAWIVRAPKTPAERRARRITLSAVAFLTINLALYLPYTVYNEWPFLRFLLPGIAALFVLFAALITRLTDMLRSRVGWFAVAIPAVAVFVVAQAIPLMRYSLEEWTRQRNVQMMGHYLQEVLPQNAVVLSFAHSGAVAHYTGREILRPDLIPPQSLDAVVDALTRRGYRPVLVIDQVHEEASFRQLFAQSRYGRLDWSPRAAFYAQGAIKYFDLLDRARFLNGERWLVDELR